MNVQLCTKFCSLKKLDFSFIILLKSGSNCKTKLMSQKLERNSEDHFNHSFGTFEHVSVQNWIYEQNSFNLDQCALESFILTKILMTQKDMGWCYWTQCLMNVSWYLGKQSRSILCDWVVCHTFTALFSIHIVYYWY